MMDIQILLRGLVIGFSIAAPVGPIGVLCIRRTLAEGLLFGLVSGLGAATADAVYGCIAGFGLTVISGVLIDHQEWLRLLGGVFLCYLGIRTFLARPAEKGISPGGRGLFGAYASTLFLTLTNPMTILFFAAIFAGLGAGSGTHQYLSGATLVLGVFTGSALWWLTLSGGVGFLRKSFNLSRLRWVNWISGAVITVFGLVALAGAVALTRGSFY
jgi:threonine/homoserine/homoserine lactone efflux protein